MPKKSIKEILADLFRMLKANNAPREIALGVAIGCFISMLPLYGFHTILCIIAAIAIPKANKLAILLGTNVSLPPTIATITWTAYDIGRFLLPDKHYPPISWDYIKHFNVSKISQFYYPLFLGSLILGLTCAVIAYFVTWGIAEHYRKKHALEK